MRHEVMVCTVCGHLWLIHQSYLTHPHATWCRNCNEASGCVAEALRPADTQPGPLADLFERVMLAWMTGAPAGEDGHRLRVALGVDPAPVHGHFGDVGVEGGQAS